MSRYEISHLVRLIIEQIVMHRQNSNRNFRLFFLAGNFWTQLYTTKDKWFCPNLPQGTSRPFKFTSNFGKRVLTFKNIYKKNTFSKKG